MSEPREEAKADQGLLTAEALERLREQLRALEEPVSDEEGALRVLEARKRIGRT